MASKDQKITFASLPRELRQQIFFAAFRETIVSDWPEVQWFTTRLVVWEDKGMSWPRDHKLSVRVNKLPWVSFNWRPTAEEAARGKVGRRPFNNPAFLRNVEVAGSKMCCKLGHPPIILLEKLAEIVKGYVELQHDLVYVFESTVKRLPTESFTIMAATNQEYVLRVSCPPSIKLGADGRLQFED